MTDMRYMDRLDVVAADAVGLIREKTETYGDSWKRRGGPGAWFTTVRPIDRLEGIMSRHGGDIFAAIEADPSGADGSALACVRDVMNYMILIEAHARAVLGVGPHGPAREAPASGPFTSGEADVYEEGGEYDGAAVFDEEGQPYCLIAGDLCVGGKTGALARAVTIASVLNSDVRKRLPPPHRPGTPEDGGHHAVEDAGEVTQDAAGAGGSAVATPALPLEERLRAFERGVRDMAELHGIRITCSGGGDGLCRTVRVLD